jgi:DNA-binding GntR family transcriptional regulator
MELCSIYNVSRFTVREAMRRLRDAGIVTSRPKAGTLVISARGTKPYTQTIDSLEDLRQYANDTEIRMVYLGEVTVDAELAHTIPVTIGEHWHVGLAVRSEVRTKLPLCLTRIYVNPAFDEIPRWIDAGKDALYKMIEDHYGISVARVEQRIQAVSLAPDDALHLQSKPNTPALRNIRLYYDDGGRLIQASDNLHPGDRFSYAMSIRRSA